MKYCTITTDLDTIWYWILNNLNLILRYIRNYLFLSYLIVVVSASDNLLFCFALHSQKVFKIKYWSCTWFWMKILVVRHTYFCRQLNSSVLQVSWLIYVFIHFVRYSYRYIIYIPDYPQNRYVRIILKWTTIYKFCDILDRG